MRILIATGNFRFVGGIEAYLSEIVPGLIMAGHDLALMYNWDRGDGKSILGECNNDRVVKIRVSNEKIEDTIQRVKQWEPDIVYSNWSANLSIEKALLDYWPVVFYSHAVIGTCLSGTKFWRKPKPALCDKKFGLGCILRYGLNQCGGNNLFRAFEFYNKAKKQKEIIHRYHRIFVASTWMREMYIQNMVPSSKISILPLFPVGIKQETQSPYFRPQNNVLLYAGRIIENKGWRHAIEATKIASYLLNKKLKLIIAGGGPDGKKVFCEAIKNGIDFEYLGQIDPEELYQVRMNADLQLVPSLAGEGFGLVGIEAGSVGLPSAGYPVGGIPDWLISGKTGESTSSDQINPEALAKAIFKALVDPMHWHNLRIGAWQKSKEFSRDRHLLKLDTFFKGEF